MDPLDFWRYSNCALNLAAFLYLMLDLRIVRTELSSRRLYLTFSLAGMLFSSAIGSLVHAYQNSPIGPQIPLNTAAVIWCLIGLWISRDERPPVWKDMPQTKLSRKSHASGVDQ